MQQPWALREKESGVMLMFLGRQISRREWSLTELGKTVKMRLKGESEG